MDTNRLNFGDKYVGGSELIGRRLSGRIWDRRRKTRYFNERREERDFIFADAYDYYVTTPTNAYFYDTKVPYTQVTYTTGVS